MSNHETPTREAVGDLDRCRHFGDLHPSQVDLFGVLKFDLDERTSILAQAAVKLSMRELRKKAKKQIMGIKRPGLSRVPRTSSGKAEQARSGTNGGDSTSNKALSVFAPIAKYVLTLSN